MKKGDDTGKTLQSEEDGFQAQHRRGNKRWGNKKGEKNLNGTLRT